MYNNCIQAVKEKNNPDANVSTNKDNVKCSHNLTTCVIVGNTEPVYACCDDASKNPQRVYSEGMRFKDLKEVKN
tara:strand:- start:1268 stop:1489 length:222 start_codon:yes stop_codon:yes gene_type:complete